MKVQLEMFINFNGNCREAVEFYAKAFNSSVNNLMTYGEAPPDPGYAVAEADKNRVMYAGVPFGGMTMMFMDYPSGSEMVIGDNIHPTISVDSKDEVTRLFNELKEGGEVYGELGQTFFSEWYGMVKDKFGVTWQILFYSQPE
ncbi:MAG: VOC family protein [Eubacteriaceae bacterium]|nr:VOC family protein [Eubacteriaceae bacterium]